jgi:hypothetical protein
LNNSLSEFSRWARKKIHLVEEDIDMCRVIYTLHGSLSQVSPSCPGIAEQGTEKPVQIHAWRYDMCHEN